MDGKSSHNLSSTKLGESKCKFNEKTNKIICWLTDCKLLPFPQQLLPKHSIASWILEMFPAVLQKWFVGSVRMLELMTRNCLLVSSIRQTSNWILPVTKPLGEHMMFRLRREQYNNRTMSVWLVLNFVVINVYLVSHDLFLFGLKSGWRDNSRFLSGIQVSFVGARSGENLVQEELHPWGILFFLRITSGEVRRLCYPK